MIPIGISVAAAKGFLYQQLIDNGPKSTQVTSDLYGQFKHAPRTLLGFTTVLDLMPTLNWNSTWATTDTSTQVQKITQIEKRPLSQVKTLMELCAVNQGVI